MAVRTCAMLAPRMPINAPICALSIKQRRSSCRSTTDESMERPRDAASEESRKLRRVASIMSKGIGNDWGRGGEFALSAPSACFSARARSEEDEEEDEEDDDVEKEDEEEEDEDDPVSTVPFSKFLFTSS